MVRILGWLIGLVVLSASPTQAQPTPTTTYQVQPVVDHGALVGVDVTLTFRGDADGRTEVDLPRSWAGAQRLDQGLGDLRVEGARLRRRGSVVSLRHPRSAPIRLTYRIGSSALSHRTGAPARPYLPSIQSQGFTLIGRTVMAQVRHRQSGYVTFGWGPTPTGWQLSSDLDPVVGLPISFDDLADSVLVGGRDLRIVERQGPSGTVTLALRGAWRFSDAELANLYLRVVAASERFWGEPAAGYFLALSPREDRLSETSQAGLGLGDGLAIWLTQDQSLEDLGHVLVHEQQHGWLPDHFGGLTPGSGEVLDFWFSEGFTDYYALRLELILGLVGPEAFIASLDQALERQANTPFRVENSAIARAFFSDPAIAGIPYHRGLLLALMLDDRLWAMSGDRLDDLMLSLPSGQGAAPDRLIAAYGLATGLDLRPDLFEHIDRGEPVRFPPQLFGNCVSVVETAHRQRLVPGPGLENTERAACVARLSGSLTYKDILI